MLTNHRTAVLFLGNLLLLLSFPEKGTAQPCGEWDRVPSVDPSATLNLLFDTAFVRRDEGLSVGFWDSEVRRESMIQRWSGSAWSLVNLPDLTRFGTQPTVEGTGSIASDLWVVGYVRTSYPTDFMPLVLRWRDGAWDYMETPRLRKQNTYPFGDRGGFAEDMDGTAPDDLWVVGTAAGYGDASATSVGLALHFDGSNWEDVEVPIVGNRTNQLYTVSASSSDNVWAVGYWRNIAGAYQALIVRWDGASWQPISNPGEGASGGAAESVIALAQDDVWVSGVFNNGADNLIHWNGQTWDVVDAGNTGTFVSFAATGPDDIWTANAPDATFYHYDGRTWATAGSPVIPGSTYILRGWSMATVGDCDVWSVGGWSDGVVQYSLTEHLTGSTIDCGAISKFTARCRSGRLVAKIAASLPAGTELTITRNGGDAKTLVINDQGKGKVKWGGQTGAQALAIAECGDWSQTTQCP